ncbi:tetratricopeptide repeat protein [Archangium sp.]|uniref:tetratricopeptide repeat protein n=1 Tax=Archangium sp. TaxID=1872627 RepID=UPI00389AE3AE
MPRLPLLRFLPLLLCLALWMPARQAHAQKPQRQSSTQKPARQAPAEKPTYDDPSMLDPSEMAVPEELTDESTDEESADEGSTRAGHGKNRKGHKTQDEAPEEEAAKHPEAETPAVPTSVPVRQQPAAPPPVVRPPPPPILTPRVTDADLQAAWDKWQKAVAALDMEGARKAQQELVSLKDDVAALDMESLSIGFIRAAEGRRKANDSAGALQLVEHAVSLSPNLPYARLALAEAYARRSPGDVGAYSKQVKAAVSVQLKDPRYRRPALADLGTVLLVALLATAAVVVGVLFLRRARFFLHDFHHLLPRAAARWQSAALAVLLLIGTPLALRLGLVPVLLILLLSVAVYLSTVERVVAGVLLVVAAFVPVAAGKIAHSSNFAGTVAEDVYVLERGGLAVEPVAERVRARYEKKEASFAELFALGRFEARRGQMENAITHYRAAMALRPGHAVLMTNLANALFATGDQDGASRMYAEASAADPGLAAPAFNLAEVYRRRAAVAPDSEIGSENQKARDALNAAQRLDTALLMWQRPPEDRLLMNKLLIGPPLPDEDLPPTEDLVAGERVEAQLSRRLLGGGSGLTAWGLPVLGALAAFGLGFAGRSLKASHECEKCGRPVCRRCDKELGVASKMCAQCVNVFSRKGAVEARVRARKQIEIERNRRWADYVSYAFGALVSGGGHLFHGLAVRGAVYAFFFLFAVSGVLLRSGVLRSPYGEVPLYLKLAPLLLLLIPLHLLTLAGLYRRQNE